MIGMGSKRTGQTVLLARGEAFPAGAKDMANPVERFTLATAVAEGLLLDPATDVVNCCHAELDDVEGVQHADGRSEERRVGKERRCWCSGGNGKWNETWMIKVDEYWSLHNEMFT